MRLAVSLATLLLLGLVAVTVVSLERAADAARAEQARAEWTTRLERAAAQVKAVTDTASELVRATADLEALPIAASATPPSARDAAQHELDEHLERAARDVGVLRLVIHRLDGPPLCGFDRARGDPPVAPQALPEAAARSTRAPAGAVALTFRSRGDTAEVVAALCRRPLGLVVTAAVDLTPALRQCATAVGPADGAWALVADGAAVWPPVGRPRDVASAGGAARVVVADDAVWADLPVTRHGLGAWRLVSTAPLVGAGDAPLLLFGGLAAGLVLLLAIRGARAALLQRSLTESERKERELTGTLNAITDVLLVVGQDLRVERANRGARDMLGWDPAERPYEDVLAVRGVDVEPELAALREVFHSGEPRHHEVQAHDDRVWQVLQYPIFTPDLKVRGVVEHARDVTHQHHLQAQLVQSEKLSTLGEMAAGIAHEINNPIGVVSMFAQLLQEEIRETQGEDAPALEKARLIEEQAVSVGEIVRGLLRFSRKSERVKRPYDPRDAVARAQSIVKHQKMLKGVTLTERIDEVPIVVGDEGQLAQVVLNLIVNACHAMDGQGTLTLAVERAGAEAPPGRAFGTPPEGSERVWVSVEDDGKGIPPEKLDRVFEPFFTTKPVGEGTGLGLSVGFAIVRDHGGCIWVHTEEGVGTRFTIDLPAASPEGPADAEAPSEEKA